MMTQSPVVVWVPVRRRLTLPTAPAGGGPEIDTGQVSVTEPVQEGEPTVVDPVAPEMAVLCVSSRATVNVAPSHAVSSPLTVTVRTTKGPADACHPAE